MGQCGRRLSIVESRSRGWYIYVIEISLASPAHEAVIFCCNAVGKSRDVRSLVAIRAKADVKLSTQRTSHDVCC
jgi:hypothetical protein